MAPYLDLFKQLYLSNQYYPCGTLQPIVDVLHYLPPYRETDRNPQFSNYNDRVSSFDNKGNKFSRPVSELADAGFYSWGLRDQIRCYHCNVGIQDLGDSNLLHTHLYLSPHCSHVLEKSRSPVDSKAIMHDNPFFRNEITQHRVAGIYVAVEYFFEEDRRRVSFSLLKNHFPSVLLDEFVRSGYFYTGLGSICRCAVCHTNEQLDRWKKPSLCHEDWCPCRYWKKR